MPSRGLKAYHAVNPKSVTGVRRISSTIRRKNHRKHSYTPIALVAQLALVLAHDYLLYEPDRLNEDIARLYREALVSIVVVEDRKSPAGHES